MRDELWSDEEEDWSEAHDDETVESEPVPCPECGATIYAELDHCPACGYWLTDADLRALGTGTMLSGGRRLAAWLMLAVFVGALVAGAVALF